MGGVIRRHDECECGIEKIVPRNTDWHHEPCRGMTNGDRKGLIFLSHPHTNNELFVLLNIKYHLFYLKNMKKLPENPKYAEMRHGDLILTLE